MEPNSLATNYALVGLIVGGYGVSFTAIIGCYIYVHRRSNHMSEKIDALKDSFSGYKVETSRTLGRIEASVKALMKFNMTDEGL